MNEQRVLSEILRLLHDMASPLGVLCGVMSDLRDGYRLTEEEIADGSFAGRRLVDIIGEIRSVALLITEKPTENDRDSGAH